MSGIFGILSRDARPVKKERLERMKAAMERWGPDGQAVWMAQHIGLGHMKLTNTPEAESESLPVACPKTGRILTSTARLDNREELAVKLGLPASLSRTLPDSEFLLLAFEKWGPSFPEQLIGNFCCAIWNPSDQTLHISRDHNGNTGLYYTKGEHEFVFGSSIKAVLAIKESANILNQTGFIRLLTFGIPPEKDESIYQGIKRLPPAHRLCISSRSFSVKQYWDLEQTPELIFKRPGDYTDAFMEIFNHAVTCRLRSKGAIGLMLSGGLDSGSVAAVASENLKQNQGPLYTFSSIPMKPCNHLVPKNKMADESPLIRALVNKRGNLYPVFHDAARMPLTEAIQTYLDILAQPAASAGNIHWLLSLFKNANSRGVKTMLTGQFGNNTISWAAPGYLAELVRKRKPVKLIRELIAHATFTSQPRFRILRQQVISPLITQGLRRDLQNNNPLLNPKIVQKDLIKEFRKEAKRTNVQSWNTRHNQWLRIKPGLYPGGYTYAEWGGQFGMEFRDPTADKRILEFCYALPADVYFERGIDRALVRNAMQNKLPRQTIYNRQRGFQGADIGLRVLNEYDDIQKVMETIKGNTLATDLLNISFLDDMIQKSKQGITLDTNLSLRTYLLTGLLAGLFLSRL